MAYRFTTYFETKALTKRPHLTREMRVRVVEAPLRKKLQEDGEREGFWATGGPSTTPFQTGDSGHKDRYFPETDSLCIDLAEVTPSVSTSTKHRSIWISAGSA